ncbi:hypothetical protein NDU88_004171 [Pleurodeles waltl]|uniref:Uncharacterized protein n=1 Tax=Pleurodeles waltl TaxID=8319 RepID=A0AAV7QC61_PLEWA|nr:hypothetical protein NDU88_004171 [Pleurodeles waltl]
MEEDQVVEQQDDLEKMIAHMRAEALKRGKDWLRAKMEDKGGESQEREVVLSAPLSLIDNAGATEHTTPPQQKENKRHRSEGKPARKPAKRAKVMVQGTRMTQQQHQRPADHERQQRVSI